MNAITDIMGNSALKNMTEALNVLGLTVIGGLTASYVGLSTTLKYVGAVTVDIQKILDGILPNLLPLLFTLGVYYLISKKKVSIIKVMLLIFVFGFVLSLCKII